MNSYFYNYNNITNMASCLAEDVNAPELRNPTNSAIRAEKQDKSANRSMSKLMSLLLTVFAA